MTLARKGTAPAVAAIILFGMIFTVGFGYFYATTSAQINGEKAAKQAISNQAQQLSSQAQLLVYGAVYSNTLEFYVNNTGTAQSIIAYWILNGTTAKVVQYENSSTLNILPYSLNQGHSTNPPIDTNISVVSISATFVIKVLTSTGIVAFGAYPNQYISASTLNAEVASGIGSALISFGTFYWYDYVSGPPSTDADGDFNEICANGIQCNGGTWQIDISHPHAGPLVPEGQNHTNDGCSYCGIMDPIVFSVNITNQDPQQADLIITDQTNLWIVETCDAGTPTSHCGVTSPVYVFYAVNMNQNNGKITSTAKGSFAQIQIPYGVTKTIYFAAAFPLHSNKLQEMSLSTDDSTIPGNNLAYYGQFAIFMLLPGTRVPPNQVLAYAQNIPFESTIAGDNIGWYTQTPNNCTGGQYTPFQLTVNNSWFSGANVSKVSINASAFSSLSAFAPAGWSQGISNGIITWTNNNVNNLINLGSALTFTWAGFAPSVSNAVQDVFPVSVYWSSGALTKLQGAAACFVNVGSQYPPPTSTPLGIVHYVPIILTNFQTSPVSGGTPIQLSPVNWNTYNAYLDNPVDNVLFFDYSGNSLNAWIQSGTANNINNAIVWVQLNSSGILPVTSVTIYMGFYAKGTSHLSATGPFGESGQLSGSYGAYDDGGTVFSFYDNFAGVSLNPSWTVVKSGGGSVTVNNGISFKANAGSDYALIVSQLQGQPLVAESDLTGAQSKTDPILGVSTTTSSNSWIALYNGYSMDESTANNLLTLASNLHSGGTTVATQAIAGMNLGVWQVVWSATGSESATDGVYTLTGVSASPTIASYRIFLGISNYNSGTDTVQWARMRLVPPNNVLPQALFGPVF